MLDVDGVLNRFTEDYSTPVTMVGDIMTMAEPELVYRLNLIVDRTDAEIVLSSSWRHQPDWREALKASGVFKPLLDRTPRFSDHRKYGIEYDQRALVQSQCTSSQIGLLLKCYDELNAIHAEKR